MAQAAQAPLQEEGNVETKAQRFERLAKARMTNALKAIELVGNLSAKGNYDYTDTHVEAIQKALVAKVTDTINLFKSGGAAVDGGFDFN